MWYDYILNFKKIREFLGTVYLNLVVIIPISACWVIFLIGLIWAFRRDRRDINKKYISSLEDNIQTAMYGYIVAIYTGLTSHSETTSKVFIKLHGRRNATREREMKLRGRKVFEMGGQDWFFLRTHEHLGEIVGMTLIVRFMGSRPDWYLRHIRVKDVTTGKSYVFLINDWYRVKDANGEFEDFFTPLISKDLRKCSFVMKRRFLNDLRERHLWFSIFKFPPRSPFTRAQRLACVFSLLMVTMMASILFYEAIPEKNHTIYDKEGINYVVSSILVVGMKSSLIAFFFGFLMLEFFKHIKYPELIEKQQLKQLAMKQRDSVDNLSGRSSEDSGELTIYPQKQVRPSPNNTESKRQDRFMKKFWISRDENFAMSSLQEGDAEIKPSKLIQRKPDTLVKHLFDEMDCHYPRPMSSYYDFSSQAHLSSLEEVGKKRCRRIFLSHCCLGVAWFVAINTSVVCTFFVLLYGLPYGFHKSIDWLMSNVLSFLLTTLLWDLLHVLMYTLLATYCIELPEGQL